jgi:outer membrane lipoprotein-sorting protein
MVPFRSHLAQPRRSLNRSRRILVASALPLALALACAQVSPPDSATPNTIVAAWLGSQTNLETWSADVIQSRSLKSLAHPITATGRVWFAAPNLFRWELGDPPQTIAVRQADHMSILYPRLRRVERYPLDDGRGGPWRDALALIEAGFPRSQAELDSRFRLLAIDSTEQIHLVHLQPQTQSARRLMPRITLVLSRDPLELHATELEFADGSSMRNDFTNVTFNPVLDPGLFQPQPDPDWDIVHP